MEGLGQQTPQDLEFITNETPRSYAEEVNPTLEKVDFD